MIKKNLLASVRAKLYLQPLVASVLLMFLVTMVGCGGGDSKSMCFTTNAACMAECKNATYGDIGTCHKSCSEALKACYDVAARTK